MYLIPYVYKVAPLLSGKTLYTVQILQEGTGAWQENEEDIAEALEANGLFTTGALAPVALGGHACVCAAVDLSRTDLSAMYSAEELPPTDTTTHRWHTYRLLTNTVDNSIWLPPPPDATVAPFPLLELLRHILKARGVDLVNGDGTA